MNEKERMGVKAGSRYKNKNYYLRSKGELPKIEYNDLDAEIAKAGL